jgi:two-component system, NarL family, response regulator NreC
MNLLLADDHAMFRQGLRAFLEREGHSVVAEAADGREAVRLARARTPQVAVLDLGMPLLNGIDAARQIRKRAPGTAIVLLTMFDGDVHVLGALRSGVRGYVLKTQAAADLCAAIKEVAQGGLYVSPGVSQAIIDAVPADAGGDGDPLSARERQVLQLIAEGQSTREVAATLAISIKTAESHRTRIMSKLDLHNTAGLVRHAIRTGLIQP